MAKAKTNLERRRERVRHRLRLRAGGRPRLSVYRSQQHIYAQVIDDAGGRTLAAASSLDKDLRESLKTGADTEAARAVGAKIAERAVAAGVRACPSSVRRSRSTPRSSTTSGDTRWPLRPLSRRTSRAS